MNTNRHFYLYAKGGYRQSTNRNEDLRVLVAKRLMLPVDKVKPADINRVLGEIVLDLINNSQDPAYYFCEFVFDVMDGHSSFFDVCLSWMECIPFKRADLGAPDPTILPICIHIRDLVFA
jgi:hypothetical protein